MKYALVDGERVEAQGGLSGKCPGCDGLMVAKCGEIRIQHWAHRGQCKGDSWWEPETEWHRAWKNHFPDSWQEVRHDADGNEIHIADVKTDQGCVLEFQHSPIKSEERRARDTFYKQLVWIVDATTRKRDRTKFEHLLKEGVRVNENVPMLKLRGFLDECALLRDWVDNPSPVFFDFGEEEMFWYLLPQASTSIAYILKFSRQYFIKLHRDGKTMKQELDFWFRELVRLQSDYETSLRSRALRQPTLQAPGDRRYLPKTFSRYFSTRARLKKRF